MFWSYPMGLKYSKMKTVTATTDRHMTNIIIQTAGLYGSREKIKGFVIWSSPLYIDNVKPIIMIIENNDTPIGTLQAD